MKTQPHVELVRIDCRVIRQRRINSLVAQTRHSATTRIRDVAQLVQHDGHEVDSAIGRAADSRLPAAAGREQFEFAVVIR